MTFTQGDNIDFRDDLRRLKTLYLLVISANSQQNIVRNLRFSLCKIATGYINMCVTY